MKTSTLKIRTPEGIAFSQVLAGPVTRFLACFIDQVCIQALVMALTQILAMVMIIDFNVGMAVYILGCFVLSIGYGILLEWTWRGQTIGKRVLRLRVMDVEGMRLQFHQIVMRNLLRFVDSLPLFYFVGGVACWLTPRCQRLGDIAANTVVVRHPSRYRARPRPGAGRQIQFAPPYPHLAARLRQRVSPAEADSPCRPSCAAKNSTRPPRANFFGELAAHFRAKVEFPSEATDGVADEQFLRNVVDVIYRTRP